MLMEYDPRMTAPNGALLAGHWPNCAGASARNDLQWITRVVALHNRSMKNMHQHPAYRVLLVFAAIQQESGWSRARPHNTSTHDFMLLHMTRAADKQPVSAAVTLLLAKPAAAASNKNHATHK